MALVPAFRCAHSGLYYPPDYCKEWGRKYGVGLGSKPVSEVLNTEYLFPAVKGLNGKMMHPVGNTYAQVDFCYVAVEEYNENQAILQADDPTMETRSAILRDKQSQNIKSATYVYVKPIEMVDKNG
jgi:hypothetical protein